MKSMRYRPPVFPFTALVGQDLLKLGLVLNAVNPRLGGILIRGHKGTAKSTAARALAELLPEIDVVRECVYGCDPGDTHAMCLDCRDEYDEGEPLSFESTPVQMIDLPLNTTEDRLVGSIDFEHALHTGKKRFLPGLLADCNRGIIYIDEVNLLEDHLVDILLDAAVTGINVVQRESIGFVHPSSFILIATMNPEEGDIRPQLLDRFGLLVTIEGLSTPRDRLEVIRRREQFDEAPGAFLKKWENEQKALKDRIGNARRLLAQVVISEEQLFDISEICTAYQVAGHRADIIMVKAARTLAALGGRTAVTQGDIHQAAQLVLPHRAGVIEPQQEKDGEADGAAQEESEPSREMEAPGARDGESDSKEKESFSPDQSGAPQPEEGSEQMTAQAEVSRAGDADETTGAENMVAGERVVKVGDSVQVPSQEIQFARDQLKRRTGRRRAPTTTVNKSGRYIRSTARRLNNDLAFDATLRAAAPFQLSRPRNDLAVTIKEQDIREKIRQKKTSNLLLFVVDASGSMGTRLMTETKGTILALLMEAYQKRDKVGMVAFKAQDAEVLLPPTNSVEMAKKLLEELPTGGKTPLGTGLLTAYQLIRFHLRKDPDIFPLVVIITDGRANVGIHREKSYEGPQFREIFYEIDEICHLYRLEEKIRTMVIDVEEKGLGGFDRSRKLAEGLNAKYHVLEDIISRDIVETVKQEID